MYQKEKKLNPVLLIVLAVVLLAVGIAVWFLLTHVRVAGTFYSRSAEVLDLRFADITTADYEKLRKKAPNSEILWRIPFQGKTYDQNTDVLYVAPGNGGTAEIEWTDFAAALVNDPQVCEEAARVVDELLGEGHVVTDRELSLSGDNFAEFELYKPGAYAYLGTGNPDLPHTMITNHNGGFDVDENALVTGAGLYVGYTVARLG